ncbi:MAG: hypothetical protein HDS07_06055 [Bacteroides sp.]|nr:hypothetical protein [Bacteroides sp.]
MTDIHRHIRLTAILVMVTIASALTCRSNEAVRDHLGNNRLDVSVTSSATGQSAVAINQAVHYYPFGLPMGCSHVTDYQRWLFGDKEFDRTHGLDLYDQAARQYDPILGRFRRPDPFAESFYGVSPYLFCIANPLLLVDKDGEKVEIFTTKLPSDSQILKDWSHATHTFILVTDQNGIKHRFAYGAKGDQLAAGLGVGGRLQCLNYNQDEAVSSGENTADLKKIIEVAPPADMSQEEFDQKVIEVAKSFGDNEGIKYRLDGGTSSNDTYGNCNSSTSTILLKAGVSKEQVEKIKQQIPGLKWGFESTAKPWTKEEQKKAVENKKRAVDAARVILTDMSSLIMRTNMSSLIKMINTIRLINDKIND